MEQVKISSLILDFDLYPRVQVNGMHVRDICDAIEAGVELPAVIADKKTKRIIDGFHRVTSFKRLKLETIPVIWKTYKSDPDMFLDAVKYNAAHGQKFSHYEIVRIYEKCMSLGVDPEIIAGAANLTIARLSEFVELKTARNDKDKLVPIKRTLSGFRGRRITKRQIEGNTIAGGHHVLWYVNQVINILEMNLADLTNEKITGAFKRLDTLIRRKIKKAA